MSSRTATAAFVSGRHSEITAWYAAAEVRHAFFSELPGVLYALVTC